MTVSAIVVGDFQTGDADNSRNMGGFYLQEEESDSDDDDSTSEGIFIYEGSTIMVDVKLGDLVEVTGTVLLNTKSQLRYPRLHPSRLCHQITNCPRLPLLFSPRALSSLKHTKQCV